MNDYWGKKFGAYSNDFAKNHKEPWGNCFFIPRGSNGRAGGVNSKAAGKSKMRFYQGRVLKPFKSGKSPTKKAA